jgi:hypothetical protein
MKKRGYHQQTIKRHYGGQLRGLSHSQLYRQRGLWGVKLGPANRGRRASIPPSVRRSKRRCATKGGCEAIACRALLVGASKQFFGSKTQDLGDAPIPMRVAQLSGWTKE